MIGIRDVLDQKEVLRCEAQHQKAEAQHIELQRWAKPAPAAPIKDVVIGISPAFGLKLFQTTAGHRCQTCSGGDGGEPSRREA